MGHQRKTLWFMKTTGVFVFLGSNFCEEKDIVREGCKFTLNYFGLLSMAKAFLIFNCN